MTSGTVDALGPVPLPRMETARMAADLLRELARVQSALERGEHGYALDLVAVAQRHPLFGHVAIDPSEMREHLPAPRWTHGDTGGIPD